MLKKLLLVLLFFGLIFSPIIFLSTPSLLIVQSFLDKNKDKEWAQSWQLSLARLYITTFREEDGIRTYKIFLSRYPNHKNIIQIKFDFCMVLAKAEGRKQEAISAFNEFIELYPEHELTPQAEKKRDQLIYVSF